MEKNNEEIKEILKEEKLKQELENFKENEINWLEDDYWNNWGGISGHIKKLLGHKKEYYGKPPKMFFLAHTKDTIRGKPQLIEQVQRKIPLIRSAVKKEKDKETKEEIEIQSFYLFDEKYDKRYDGFQVAALALDFWLYRIISEEGKEYYILTQEKLPNCTCNFKGMLVELDDFAEFSRSLKMKSLSRLFFMKEFEPDIKILTKEQLIEFTKSREIDEVKWLDFLAYNPLGNYNRFPDDVEKFKSSQILSGKLHNYPNHQFIFGVAGSKKTMGYIETIAHKFEEEVDICEGGASRMKGLEPSFKEKPAELGYLARKERMAWVDEIGKMIEGLGEKAHRSVDNALGSINFLLEHRKRKALSGNDKLDVQATAKFIFVTNPISNKRTIYEHVGLIDPSTLSRFIVWVQDEEEMNYVLSNKGVEETSRSPTQDYETKKNKVNLNDKEKRNILLKNSSRNYLVKGIDMTREEFLSLYDTCYNFTCELDKLEVERIVVGTTQLAKEPMKSTVWKPRAYHHTYLIIDGLVKHRCLFKDYDSSFSPKQEDYDLAERILIRMVKGWDTNLSPKEQFNGF